MKRILITGAGGFIGGFLVEEALRRGYETWAGVRPSTNLEYLQDKRIKFIDLAFANSVELNRQLKEAKAIFGGWDVIVHNLGLTKEKKKGDFEEVNFQYVVNFVNQLLKTDCMPNQFIYMSSLASYGVGDETCGRPIMLADKPNPNTLYGKSKLKAENFVRTFPGLRYVILRPTGVYGPRERDYFIIMDSIRKGIDFAGGFKKQLQTFIYVEDLVAVIYRCIDKDVDRKAYFVADGDAYTGKEFRELVMKTVGRSSVITFKLPLIVIKIISLCAENVLKLFGKTSVLNADKYRIMKQRNWTCETEPLQTELDFVPRYPLEKGIEETIAWYKANKWM